MRLTLENTWLPWSWAEKSWRCGIGYLSASVASLSLQKLPQGCQEPSSFGTMCKGDDHALLEWRTTPAFDMSSKATLAAASLSGGSLLALAKTGHPKVRICRVTPFFTVGSEKRGTRIQDSCSPRIHPKELFVVRFLEEVHVVCCLLSGL